MNCKLKSKLQGTLSALKHILRKHHRYESQASSIEQTKEVIRSIATPTLYGFKKTGIMKYNLLTKKMISVEFPLMNYINFNSDRSTWVCYRIHRVMIVSSDSEGNEGSVWVYNDEEVSMNKLAPLKVARFSVGLVAYK